MERKMIYVDNQTQGIAYGAESTQEMIKEVVKHLDDDVIRVNITLRNPLDYSEIMTCQGEGYKKIIVGTKLKKEFSCFEVDYNIKTWKELNDAFINGNRLALFNKLTLRSDDILYLTRK